MNAPISFTDPTLDTGEVLEIPTMVDGDEVPVAESALGILNNHAHIFLIAFAVTLFITPVIRKIAISLDIIDHPDEARKTHSYPVAYLGGVAVFLGIISAIAVSYVNDLGSPQVGVPLAVVLGMVVIAFTGLVDDVSGLFPRIKLAGQLVAAAALAINEVGVHVAEGLLTPIIGPADTILFAQWGMSLTNAQVFYWVGTAIIAIFVLGGCNAANFLDGLDGLLTGVVAIVTVGLLCISILMALKPPAELLHGMDLSHARIVLCLALLGAVVGFLPHNFNPASIFLGDSGSLLLGFSCVSIILMLGDQAQTYLVFAGLIVFSLPIIDTTLAIIRRKLAGIPMSVPDDQHLHHQLKQALGGVKRAVVALYGISIIFAIVGVSLAALALLTSMRVRVVYVIAFVLFSFIGMMGLKMARLRQLQKVESKRKSRSRSSSSAKVKAADKPAPEKRTPPHTRQESSTPQPGKS